MEEWLVSWLVCFNFRSCDSLISKFLDVWDAMSDVWIRIPDVRGQEDYVRRVLKSIRQPYAGNKHAWYKSDMLFKKKIHQILFWQHSFAEIAVLCYAVVMVLLWFWREPKFVPGWASIFKEGYVNSIMTINMMKLLHLNCIRINIKLFEMFTRNFLLWLFSHIDI